MPIMIVCGPIALSPWRQIRHFMSPLSEAVVSLEHIQRLVMKNLERALT